MTVPIAPGPLDASPLPLGTARRAGGGVTWVVGTVKTVCAAVATMIVATFLVFVGLQSTAGDPVSNLLGPHSTATQRAALRAQLGLDDPLVVRYWHWLSGALHGDLGTSIVYRAPVSDLAQARLGTTLELVAYAGILVLVFGLATGIVGAVWRPMRPVVVALNGALIAIPSYVAAFVLISFFAVRLGWFPTGGTGVGFWSQVHYLTLPAIALALAWAAYLSQLTRATVLDELDGEHVATARGRGLPPSLVFRRHVLRNSAGPIVTAVGMIIAYLVTGTVVVETVFSIDGLGSFLVKSVESKDTDVVMAITALLVVVFVVTTTVVEALQRALDPRIRGGGN